MYTVSIDTAEGRFWWRSPGSLRVCLTVAAIGFTFLTGCARDAGTVASADTVRVGARGTGEGPAVIADFLFAESLLAIDQTGRPTDRLAVSWSWGDHAHAFTVKLRQGVRFHDGRPVTASVVAAIFRQQIEESPAEFESVNRIDTPDELSVVFRLSRPDAFLIGAIAGVLIVDPAKPDIGTGPFKLLTRKPELEAERNDSYYRGRPGVRRVQMIPYDTPRAVSAALMRGDVDVAHEVNRESIEFLKDASRVELFTSLKPFYIPLVFNLRHPVLGRVEVRRAIAEAIDREKIVEQAMRGHGRVAEDPVWPLHWAWNPAARRHTYNPAAARVRLDAAGLSVKPPPAGSHAMASRFMIKCVFWKEDSQFERIALMLQRQLAEVGIDLELEGAERLDLIKRIQEGKFETYLYQQTSGRSFGFAYRFWHSPPKGKTGLQGLGWNGADDVLDRLRTASADVDVRIAVGDLRERFYEDVPAAFLAWTQTTRGVDRKFDVKDPAVPEIFENVWRWHPSGVQSASR